MEPVLTPVQLTLAFECYPRMKDSARASIAPAALVLKTVRSPQLGPAFMAVLRMIDGNLNQPLCRSQCLLFIRRHAPAREIEDRIGGITPGIYRTHLRTSIPVVS
jgi:hypothetical protein